VTLGGVFLHASIAEIFQLAFVASGENFSHYAVQTWGIVLYVLRSGINV
jgi:hypothetical protein